MIRFIAIILAAFPLLAFGQPFSLQDQAFVSKSSPLLRSLIAYWRLEEPANIRYDCSPNGYHLTSNNGTTNVAAKVGYGALFDVASSQSLPLVNTNQLGFGDSNYTITAWFYMNTKTANRPIVCKDNFTTTKRDYQLLYRQGTDRINFFAYKAGNTQVSVSADALGSPSINTWYFVAAWHDASAQTISVQVNNGNTNTTAVAAALQSTQNPQFNLGANSEHTLFMDGRIDEVGIWNRVLTAAERTQLYRSGNGVTFPRFASFQFDWSSQMSVFDSGDADAARTSLTTALFGGSLPSEIGTLSSVASPVAGLTDLDTTQKITMSAYASRPRLWTPTSPAGSVMILHQGHSLDYNGYQYGQALQTYLTAGVAVCGLVMPGGVDEVTSGTSTEHNTAAYGMDDFVGPVIVAVNTLIDIGYTDIFMSGLSGGGWTTVLSAAADTRIDKSFPTAGSLPLYDPVSRDFEQFLNLRGISQTYLDCYVLGTYPSRRQLQINYTTDNCCFSQAQFNAGPDFRAQVAYIAASLGGSYEFLWQNYTTHQFEPAVITTYILPEL